MNKFGYASKDLYSIEMQMEVLMVLIEIESENVLESLLKKTYFRLLKKINRGIEYLSDIIETPEEWVLNKIENDIDAWTDSSGVSIISGKYSIPLFIFLSKRK